MQKCYMQKKMWRGDWRRYKKVQHWRAQTFHDNVCNSKGCSPWEGSCSLPIQGSRTICYLSQCPTDCGSSLICKTDGSSPERASFLNRCKRTGDKHLCMMMLLLRFHFLRKQHLRDCTVYPVQFFHFPTVFEAIGPKFSAEFDRETHLKAMKLLPVL